MSSSADIRERLLKKLNELFRLDQPDLDFGFYKIMHTKAKQVSEFLEKDLLKIVEDAFGEADAKRIDTAKEKYEQAVETARAYGATDLEKSPKVIEAREQYEAAKISQSAETQIYDHLYRFFERYYDNGDFISRRYYTRETAGKSAPYAIPYNGEEVMLHWANADQYYIKSAEYFTNFTFDLNQAKEVQAATGMFDNLDSSMRVHFTIIDATEGEHGDIKADDQQKRYFIIHRDNPIVFNDHEELVVNFVYCPDPSKTGQDAAWQNRRNGNAVEVILAALQSSKHKKAKEYLALLKTATPTESDKNRILLAKYIYQYTSRNTMDYFIHKDLGGFLHRELDFYIKNEVMRLDDIENADAPAVEIYLAKVKVLRKIASKLIDFLAQLEDFQKKLWLKKKFVVETNYCITLDRVPEELYPEIAANDAQRQEWAKLFAIDEIQGDLTTPGYSEPLTVEFLKVNDKLVLDTGFFSKQFACLLIDRVKGLDNREGTIIHSENFQALNLLQRRYIKVANCVYIDPPYNTDASPILYKNSYKKSSWSSMLSDRVFFGKSFLSTEGVFIVAIDDEQVHEMGYILSRAFNNMLGTICVRSNPSGRPTQTGYSVSHEYLLFGGNSSSSYIGRMPPTPEQRARFSQIDRMGPYEWRNLRREGSDSDRAARPQLYYPIFITKELSIRVPKMRWDAKESSWVLMEKTLAGEQVVYPDNEEGTHKRWRWEQETVSKRLSELAVRKDRAGRDYVYYKRRPNEDGVVCISSWFDSKYSATEHGTAVIKKLFGQSVFSYPKSLHAVKDAIFVGGISQHNSLVLDFFAGSGTTGHAVIDLNRDDEGNRKYILVEMGDYFDTVLKPRICKVVYSDSWKDGKPTARHTGVSHCFKYIRLESYEDTLNNLRFDENPARDKFVAGNPSLKEDYILHYMLDVETRGSQSLLNIDSFVDPRAYTIRVKKPGSDEYVERQVDLLETFNYLIGLRVERIFAPQAYYGTCKRVPDPEVPSDQKTKLVLDGKMQMVEETAAEYWWFRKVEGWVPKDLSVPDGPREKVLIIWRTLTGDLEKDNLMLDEWFKLNKVSFEFAFDTVFVNGSSNLQSLTGPGENWKVYLLEEEFMKRMWDTEGV